MPNVGNVEVAAENGELNEEYGVVDGLWNEPDNEFLLLVAIIVFHVFVRVHVLDAVVIVLSVRRFGAFLAIQIFV